MKIKPLFSWTIQHWFLLTFLLGNNKNLYSINIQKYDLTKYRHRLGAARQSTAYAVDVYFYDSEQTSYFYKFEIHYVENQNIEWIEEKIAQIYDRMNFVPDIHNQD